MMLVSAIQPASSAKEDGSGTIVRTNSGVSVDVPPHNL